MSEEYKQSLINMIKTGQQICEELECGGGITFFKADNYVTASIFIGDKTYTAYKFGDDVRFIDIERSEADEQY